MDLDHLFLFIDPDGPEPAALKGLGLRESFRRTHPGQGTANRCYCFDNAYLELLWLSDEAEARAPGVARSGLAGRAHWRENGANPFGLALRGAAALPFDCWDYRPAYLPDGMAIPMALFSEDPAQPLVFRSPGDARPDRWRDGRDGARQRAAGFREIAGVELILPAGVPPAPDLDALAQDADWLTVTGGGAAPRMILTLTRDGGTERRLRLPDCRLL